MPPAVHVLFDEARLGHALEQIASDGAVVLQQVCSGYSAVASVVGCGHGEHQPRSVERLVVREGGEHGLVEGGFDGVSDRGLVSVRSWALPRRRFRSSCAGRFRHLTKPPPPSAWRPGPHLDRPWCAVLRIAKLAFFATMVRSRIFKLVR